MIAAQRGLEEADRLELLVVALWPKLPANSGADPQHAADLEGQSLAANGTRVSHLPANGQATSPVAIPAEVALDPAPWGRCAYERCRASLPEPVKRTARPRRYCDRRCWEEARLQARRPPRPCETCGTMFEPAQVTTRYCSKRCWPSTAMVVGAPCLTYTHIGI